MPHQPPVSVPYSPALEGRDGELASTGHLSLAGLITHPADAQTAPAAFGEPGCLKTVLDWRNKR